MILVALASFGARAAEIVDMVATFDTFASPFIGTVTTQNGHTGTWVAGYGGDAWESGY